MFVRIWMVLVFHYLLPLWQLLSMLYWCYLWWYLRIFGGFIDNIMMRIAEIVNGIPYLLIVIILMIVMKPGVSTIIIALAMVWMGWYSSSCAW